MHFTSALPDDMEDMSIPVPDSITTMNFEKAGNLYDQLQVLTGKEFPRILGLVQGKDIQVVQDLINEMWDHWDNGNDASNVPGGKGD